jgi:prepilin-type N-terminal cleavage/methylation domain-containing protein
MTEQQGQSGFTITELLVSVIIIAIGVVGFVTAVGLVSAELRIGKRDTDVAMLVADQAELIKALPYDSIQPGSRTEGSYQLSWNVEGTDPKKVVLSATFPRQSGGTLADTVVLYISR